MFVTAPKCRELSSKLNFFARVPIKVSKQILSNKTYFDIPVMKVCKSFFKLYHLHPFLTRMSNFHSTYKLLNGSRREDAFSSSQDPKQGWRHEKWYHYDKIGIRQHRKQTFGILWPRLKLTNITTMNTIMNLVWVDRYRSQYNAIVSINLLN